MNKLLSLIVCFVLVLSMATTSFAGNGPSKKSTNDSGDSFGDMISGVLGSLSDSSGDLLESLSDLAGNLSDVLGEAAEAASDSLSGIADNAGDVLSGIAENAGGVLSGIAENAGDALSDAASGLQDVLPEAANGLQEALSGAGDAISSGELEDTLNNVLGELSDLLSGLTETLNENGIKIEISDENNNGAYYDIDDIADMLDDIADMFDNDNDMFDGDDMLDDDEDDVPGRPAKIAGGWAVNDLAESSLTEDELALFDSAIEGLLGVSYTPVSILATQLVAGTNYAYLCTGTTVIPNASPEWYVVTIYKDLKGNSTILSIDDIELDDIEILDDMDKDAKVGAWRVTAPEVPAQLPENAQAAFEKAISSYVGVDFSPIALLGTQIVAGTNYKVLCFGTYVTKDPVSALFVIDIYEDLNGEAKVTNADLFDLTEYIDN